MTQEFPCTDRLILIPDKGTVLAQVIPDALKVHQITGLPVFIRINDRPYQVQVVTKEVSE